MLRGALHATPSIVYARLLGDRLTKTGASCWLVNTGWTGGEYGTGKRMSIKHTRAMLHAALDGALDGVEYQVDPVFGLHVPQTCPDVPAEVLNPRNTWDDKDAYDRKAAELADRFSRNFAQFENDVDAGVRDAGIRAAA